MFKKSKKQKPKRSKKKTAIGLAAVTAGVSSIAVGVAKHRSK